LREHLPDRQSGAHPVLDPPSRFSSSGRCVGIRNT
jgi:hypothetical protein